MRGGEGRGRRREEAICKLPKRHGDKRLTLVDVEAVVWELGNRPVDDRPSCDTKEPSNVRIFSGYKFSS